jgi:hypothetical protein
MSFEVTALVLAWGAIVMLAFAMAGLLRQVRALTMLVAGGTIPPAGPSPGQKLPADLLSDVFADGKDGGRLLAFMDHDCAGCAAIAPDLVRFGAEGQVDIRLVFRGRARELADGELAVLEGKGAAFERLQVPATPFAVHVTEDGAISHAAPIGSAEALREFVAHSRAQEVTT